jgi:CRP-like cAMP-binding protein
MTSEQQWPCHGCTVRRSNFCGALIDGPDSGRRSAKDIVAQTFLSACKDDAIERGGPDGSDRSEPLVLCEGWAYRFHQFADGRRQILSVLIPGDLLSIAALFEPNHDFSVRAATDVKICRLGRDGVGNGLATRPVVREALARLCSVETREMTSMVVDLTERDNATRVLGFIRRLVNRLSARGIGIGTRVYQFPLSNIDIADATGLSADDIGRALQKLSREGIVEISENTLTVVDEGKFATTR